jgi:hypothetical protein
VILCPPSVSFLIYVLLYVVQYFQQLVIHAFFLILSLHKILIIDFIYQKISLYYFYGLDHINIFLFSFSIPTGLSLIIPQD